MGRTTIWLERNNVEIVRRLILSLELRQCRHRSTSGIRYIAAVFRSRSRRIRYQRTIIHHAARSGSERQQTFRLLDRASASLPWLLTRAAVMSGTRCLTALARLDRQSGIIGFSRHRHIAATEKTAAGHPDRRADRQRQLNHFAHCFVREKQTHSAGSLLLYRAICRDNGGLESQQNRHQIPALL